MKPNQTDENPRCANTRLALKGPALAVCRKLRAQIESVKGALLVESRHSLQAPERLLRLALNEAEALAWQTTYPHLVFPELAAEKVRAVTGWASRQHRLRQPGGVMAFAA